MWLQPFFVCLFLDRVSYSPGWPLTCYHSWGKSSSPGPPVTTSPVLGCQASANMTNTLLLYLFKDRVSLCSPGQPGTCYIDQANLELTKIHLPLPLELYPIPCSFVLLFETVSPWNSLHNPGWAWGSLWCTSQSQTNFTNITMFLSPWFQNCGYRLYSKCNTGLHLSHSHNKLGRKCLLASILYMMKSPRKLDNVAHICNPSSRRQRWEVQEFKANQAT